MTIRRALAGLALAALAGCAGAPSEPARRAVVAPDFVTLAEQDALIELKRGARVHVRLDAEKISHRRWHITAVAGDAVKAYGMPWFATRHVYAMQEPGNWIFDFDAVAPGRSTVRFDYRRDDEPVSAAERTASFEIVVR